jgi:hypothetical protein
VAIPASVWLRASLGANRRLLLAIGAAFLALGI